MVAALVLGLTAPAFAATRPASTPMVSISGTAMDSHGDLLVGWTVAFGPRDTPADQVTATVAANGSYSVTVANQSSDVALFAPGSSYGHEHDAAEVPNVSLPASGPLNLVIGVVTATIHVDDNLGNPVAGATVTSTGLSDFQIDPLTPSGVVGDGWQTPVSHTTASAGSATFELLQTSLPVNVNPTETLAITPPAGSGLAPGSINVSLRGDGGGVIALNHLTTVLPGSGIVAAPITGTADLAMTVTLDQPAPYTVTVAWNTLYVPRVAPSPWLGPEAPANDYTASAGTVTFAPLATTAVVHIPVLADSNPTSPDEFFVVSFHNPTNAHMGGFWGLGFGVITPAS